MWHRLHCYRHRSCHAPRERVSWNMIGSDPPLHIQPSRSTWACELKFPWNSTTSKKRSHAPRERVSWNIALVLDANMKPVTLHVSVWVEIDNVAKAISAALVTLHVSVWVEMNFVAAQVYLFESRSTWACELKFSPIKIPIFSPSHAPRERVSWNCTQRI